MRISPKTHALLVLAIAAPAPAAACGISPTPAAIIATTYGVEAIVVVRVVSVRDTWDPNDTWRAEGDRTSLAFGAASQFHFEFGDNGPGIACGDRLRRPSVGATWALYLADRDGRPVTLAAFPLEEIRGIDRRLEELEINPPPASAPASPPAPPAGSRPSAPPPRSPPAR